MGRDYGSALVPGANLLPDVGDSGFQAYIRGGRCLLDLRGDEAAQIPHRGTDHQQ